MRPRKKQFVSQEQLEEEEVCKKGNKKKDDDPDFIEDESTQNAPSPSAVVPLNELATNAEPVSTSVASNTCESNNTSNQQDESTDSNVNELNNQITALKRSNIDKYFKDIKHSMTPEDGVIKKRTLATCLICNKEFKETMGTTSNFWSHLAKMHPQVLNEYQKKQKNQLLEQIFIQSLLVNPNCFRNIF